MDIFTFFLNNNKRCTIKHNNIPIFNQFNSKYILPKENYKRQSLIPTSLQLEEFTERHYFLLLQLRQHYHANRAIHSTPSSRTRTTPSDQGRYRFIQEQNNQGNFSLYKSRLIRIMVEEKSSPTGLLWQTAFN
ncbi:hypothetical protein CEXT_198801 [Caerostris extrusa]|uniref:Uncharacterized protein n=1 Tax=Caerostris extrusa TaxID=172846 RepID=A0AAV4V2A4_CAEEX|nr:hypothetical protein CEXT_198801 [Caerostris extrusa]